MKQNIHPNWHNDCKVTCSCGNTFTTGSTLEEIKVDLCSACHPFFTGEMKFVDRQGRVDKFMQKMQLAASKQAAMSKKAKSKKNDKKDSKEEKSYQQILRDQKSQLRESNVQTQAAPQAEAKPATSK